jgi:uncharacterized protein (DUF697 family)/uncharacterized membrane protein YebE (DUF533 family)
MSQITEKEGTACIRVLVAVAKADGKVTAEETAALEGALEAYPGSDDLKGMLAETIDLDAALGDIQSAAAKEALWESAYGLVHADGHASTEERELLEKLRGKLGISGEKVSLTQRLFAEAKDTVLPSNIAAISDPAKRKKEIEEDTLKYSILSAVLGAFPVPGVAIITDIAVVGLQVKLVRDIGQYWGQKMDKEAAKMLLAGLGVGTGARIAMSNVAKLVPVVGWMFGASSSFASTWAIGKLAHRFFELGQPADLKELKKAMKEAQKEGKAAFTENKDAIEAKKKESEGKITELNEQLKAGKITQAEYDASVAALAG